MRLKLRLLLGMAGVAISVGAVPLQSENSLDELPVFSSSVGRGQLADQQILSQVLGWVEDEHADNLCGGCYQDLDRDRQLSQPPSPLDAPFKVTARKPAFFTQSGYSLVQGDVCLTQPGREITADHVTFMRDHNTGKLYQAQLGGQVTFREHGKLIVAEEGDLDFTQRHYRLTDGVYRLLAVGTPTGIANVWGRAEQAINNEKGVLHLTRATYTTCSPASSPWLLWSRKLKLDRNSGRGEATHAVIFLKKLPIFYTPYLNFSIDKRRKSGFLFPAPSYSHGSGYGTNIPFYLNLAPNYDATLDPEIFERRGMLFRGKFRYLTTVHRGFLQAGHIAYDRAFAKFREKTSKVTNDPHALKLLKQSSNSRAFLSMQHDASFDPHWSGALTVNYVTDDYVVQDLGGFAYTDNDQLLNRADLIYASDNWNFLGRVLLFQTLHPLTHCRTQDQYRRLPQLNVSGDFPESWGGINYHLDGELVNFSHREDVYSPGRSIIGGARFHLMPTIERGIEWPWLRVTPKLELQGTGYEIYHPEKPFTVQREMPRRILQFYPRFALDSRSSLRRELSLLGRKYTQILEPRIFYLWVPTINQEDVPVFDTYLPPFDFNQLFRTNRFSGIDRVGDANQVSLGVTTKFLDERGQERFSVGMGQILSWHRHQVEIGERGQNLAPFNSDPLKNERWSPLVGQLQYWPNARLRSSLNLAWDPNVHQLNTMDFDLNYTQDSARVVNFWYHYVLRGDQLLQDGAIDLSRVGCSVGWKLWHNWRVIGSLNYNTSYRRAQNYLAGLEYDGCCWAMRFVQSRSFIGIGGDSQRNYDTRIYLQFLLKGLSNVDARSASDELTNQIVGYRDKFVLGG